MDHLKILQISIYLIFCILYPSEMASVHMTASPGPPPTTRGPPPTTTPPPCEWNGKLYEAGSEFQPDPCTWCTCPEEGGTAVCIAASCGFPECVDSVIDEGQCCPSCPNGPNCYAGDRIIPAGEDVVVRGYICRCEIGLYDTQCRPNGCLYSGILYELGKHFSPSPCELCHCPLDGSGHFCYLRSCPIPKCVEPQFDEIRCCYICPNVPEMLTTTEELPTTTRSEMLTTTEDLPTTTGSEMLTTTEDLPTTTGSEMLTTTEDLPTTTGSEMLTTTEELPTTTRSEMLTTTEDLPTTTRSEMLTTTEDLPTTTGSKMLTTTEDLPTTTGSKMLTTTGDLPTTTRSEMLTTTGDLPTTTRSEMLTTTEDLPTTTRPEMLTTTGDLPTTTRPEMLTTTEELPTTTAEIGCTIGGVHFSPGAVNPTNGCQRCDISSSLYMFIEFRFDLISGGKITCSKLCKSLWGNTENYLNAVCTFGTIPLLARNQICPVTDVSIYSTLTCPGVTEALIDRLVAFCSANPIDDALTYPNAC